MAKLQHPWVKAGSVVSLGLLAFAFFRGHRLLGRLSAGFAGAFLEKWDDLRLERRIADILARSGSAADPAAQAGAGPDAWAGLQKLWGNP